MSTLKTVVAALIVATMALFSISGVSAEDKAEKSDAARIHLIHGIPDTDVDVFVDGKAVFENFKFSDTQDLSAFAGETLKGVEVRLAGKDDVAIDGGDLPLPDKGNITAVAHLDADGKPTLSVFENDTTKTEAGEGRLTVRHAAAAPAVDIRANGDVAFGAVVNGKEGKTDLAAGTISADVVPAGADDPVVIGPADLEVVDGSSLIVYAVGSLEDDNLSVLTETIDGLATHPTKVNTGVGPVESSSSSTGLLLGLAGFGLLAAGGTATYRYATNRA